MKKKQRGTKYKTETRKRSGEKIKQYVNANSYKHLLSVPSTNNNYIKWAFGLRRINTKNSSLKLASMAPETFYKTIQAQKQKHTSGDIPHGTNISEFQHLTLHRHGIHPSKSLVTFQTSLRSPSIKKQMAEREKKWTTIPKKQRKQMPKFIKSSSLKKKILNPEDFNGPGDNQQFPKFTQKIINTRNFNQIKHMIKDSMNLPSICWQANLRSY